MQRSRAEQNRLNALKKLNRRSAIYKLYDDLLGCVLTFLDISDWHREFAVTCCRFAAAARKAQRGSSLYKNCYEQQRVQWIWEKAYFFRSDISSELIVGSIAVQPLGDGKVTMPVYPM